MTIIGVPAMAFGQDLAFIQMIIGYVIARIILAIVMVPHYLKGEIYSPYQLFANAFGPAARQTAGGFFLLSAFSESLTTASRTSFTLTSPLSSFSPIIRRCCPEIFIRKRQAVVPVMLPSTTSRRF
jgi:Na+/proline symporter